MPNERVAITAHDFARPQGLFSFGVSRENTAVALRKLADAVEAGDAIVSSVVVRSVADSDDFSTTELTLMLAEKRG